MRSLRRSTFRNKEKIKMALSVIEHKDNIIQDLKEKLHLYDKDTILPDEK